MNDLGILNGKICTPQGVVGGNIGIRDGIISCICGKGFTLQADRILDAEGLLVLPGVVDAHFHCLDPSPRPEDFSSATLAAASGGTTTILEMPISNPSVSNGSILNSRKEIAKAKAYVDFGLYGCCGTLDREDIISIAKNGGVGYKIFLHSFPKSKDMNYDGLSITNDHDLLVALSVVKETGLVCSVHAEDEEIIKFLTERLVAAQRVDPLAHCESRPDFVEAISIQKLISLAKILNFRLHIAHISSAMGVELVRKARLEGVDVSAETCPHYLVFDQDKMREAGPYAKINPPLRKKEDIAALWSGIRDGTICNVASDHAALFKEHKESGWTSIWLARSGVPSGELLGPIILSEALRGKIDLERAVKVLSTNPARRFGLFPQKGSILPGADADFALLDPRVERRIDSTKLFTKARESAMLFDGLKVKGEITKTIVRGELVYSDGQIVGRPGHGSFVKPTF